MAEFPKEIEVEVKWMAAILKPGDTLVVAVTQFLTNEEADRGARWLEEILPGIKAILIQGSALTVYRPEPGDEPL